jgi:hypothetical protein
MRIDILLFKTLEFKNIIGHKVKVTQIPVLIPEDPNYFMISVRLDRFLQKVYQKKDARVYYSFKDYLMNVLKWPVYRKIFAEELRNNA